MQDRTEENEDDGWDWPFLLMLAMHLFHMTEKEFWATTPKVFSSICLQYSRMKNAENGNNSLPASQPKPKKREQPEMINIDEAPSWWGS